MLDARREIKDQTKLGNDQSPKHEAVNDHSFDECGGRSYPISRNGRDDQTDKHPSINFAEKRADSLVAYVHRQERSFSVGISVQRILIPAHMIPPRAFDR